MLRLAANYGMEFKSFADPFFRLFTVPATHARLRQVGATIVSAGLAADGAQHKELTLPTAELHFLRKHYLHRSHSNATGMGANLLDGRPHRFLIRC